jgi:helicase
VTVNEKLRALLARHRELWRQVGLVVADEVQTINDRERGLCLELLLTELRVMGSGDSAAVDGTQVVALSATVPEAERLADWLRATLIADDRRPVELRMGVLCGGDFRWRACGPQGEGATGPEGLRGGEGASWEEAVEQAAAELIAEGEPTLVFVRDRRTAARLALGISGRGVAEPAREAQERLADGEATAGQAELLEALEGGTAFHHAGMSREERTVALEAFRGGEALGMVATSTLALGVNLPARNVIVDPFRWDTDVGGRPVCRWLSASEYENMAGRAGRPGLAGRAPDPFGRGILVATKALQAEAYWRRFIEGAAEPEVAAGGWEEEAVVQLAGIASRHGALSVPEVCAQTWRGARGDRAERERRQ